MTGRIEGKVALIIGAARGIGKGIAQRFAEEGAKLVLADTETAYGKATAAEIGAAFIRTDISRMEDAEAAVALALEHHGRLDIIVQNAGIYPWQLIENTTPEDWDRVMASQPARRVQRRARGARADEGAALRPHALHLVDHRTARHQPRATATIRRPRPASTASSAPPRSSSPATASPSTASSRATS